MPSPGPLLLAGPTGVGKSDVAVLLAQRLNGEILSVDSMQVYRGMDIGTAKPSRAERACVPHHLIDILDLGQTFDAAQFVAQATIVLGELQQRGRCPILCGGTGLYFQALLFGLGQAPRSDPAVRAQLEALPAEALLAELAKVDPATYSVIDRANRRRVIRAVEVVWQTGRPFSAQRAVWAEARDRMPPFPGGGVPRLIGLTREKEDLWARLDRRVDAMMAAGLAAEVSQLRGQGLESNPTASQALGYKQMLEHLRGTLSLEATAALIQLRTRQYAKRQLTWFRRQLPLDWVTIEPTESAASIADRIQEKYALG